MVIPSLCCAARLLGLFLRAMAAPPQSPAMQMLLSMRANVEKKEQAKKDAEAAAQNLSDFCGRTESSATDVLRCFEREQLQLSDVEDIGAKAADICAAVQRALDGMHDELGVPAPVPPEPEPLPQPQTVFEASFSLQALENWCLARRRPKI